MIYKLPDGTETDSARWAAAAWKACAGTRQALLQQVLEADKKDWCNWKLLQAEIRKELRCERSQG